MSSQRNQTISLGTIGQLWRYPVKSMLGETCESIEVNSRGVLGDRSFAIRAREGKFGSGKSTRRFRHIEGLFKFQAKYNGTELIVTFPDGRTMSANDKEIHDALSSALGQGVTLALEDAISHIDDGPIHLLTTSSLATLREGLPDSDADPRRFRPNILIKTNERGQVERNWIGVTLKIGDEVVVRIVREAERCGMVAFAQADLLFDARVLRWIAEESGMKFGVYADVVRNGSIRVGDQITVDAAPTLS